MNTVSRESRSARAERWKSGRIDGTPFLALHLRRRILKSESSLQVDQTPLLTLYVARLSRLLSRVSRARWEHFSMASPFSIFRKHQRILVAVSGVLLMVAFLVLPPLLDNRSSAGSKQDPVAAETKLYGNIRESDLQRMRSARALANRFVAATLATAAGYQINDPFGPDSERSVVDTMILARKAEQLGMRVTDEEITRFLQGISSDRITGPQFAEILQVISGGRKGSVSRRQVYDALRTELLARHLASSFVRSSQNTPGERWEYYQRLKNRAQIEVVPVMVADFIDKVPDPDDARSAPISTNIRRRSLSPVPRRPASRSRPR